MKQFPEARDIRARGPLVAQCDRGYEGETRPGDTLTQDCAGKE